MCCICDITADYSTRKRSRPRSELTGSDPRVASMIARWVLAMTMASCSTFPDCMASSVLGVFMMVASNEPPLYPKVSGFVVAPRFISKAIRDLGLRLKAVYICDIRRLVEDEIGWRPKGWA